MANAPGVLVALAVVVTVVTGQSQYPEFDVAANGMRYRKEGSDLAELSLKPDGGIPGRYIVSFYQLPKKEDTEALDGRIDKLTTELGKGEFQTVELVPCAATVDDCNRISIGNLRMIFVMIEDDASLQALRKLADVKYIEQDQVVTIDEDPSSTNQESGEVRDPVDEGLFTVTDGLRYRAEGGRLADLVKKSEEDGVAGRYVVMFKHFNDPRDVAELDKRVDVLMKMIGRDGSRFSDIMLAKCEDDTTDCRFIAIGNSRMLIVDIPDEASLELLRSLHDVLFIEQDAVMGVVAGPDHPRGSSPPDFTQTADGIRFRAPGRRPARIIYAPISDNDAQTELQYIVVFKNYDSEQDNARVGRLMDKLVDSMFGKPGLFAGVKMLECEVAEGEVAVPCNRVEINGLSALFVQIQGQSSLSALRALYDVEFIEQNRVAVTSGPTDTPPVRGPVDGGWSEWSRWSRCDKNCEGSQSSTRTCTNPIPMFGGKPCIGDSSRSQPCDPNDCYIVFNNAILNHYDSLIGSSLSREECLRLCLEEPPTVCMSVNYEAGGVRRCSMARVTKSSYPTDWPDIWYSFYPGWTYYERISK